jgi:hypothetical protein
VLALISQRGVGCTQVENPPLVIRYFFGANLFDRLAEEIHQHVAGWRRGEASGTGLPRRCDRGDAAGVVERTQPALGVELGALRGNPIGALRHDEISGGDCSILVLEKLNQVGVNVGLVLGVVDLDFPLADVMARSNPHQRFAQRHRLGSAVKRRQAEMLPLPVEGVAGEAGGAAGVAGGVAGVVEGGVAGVGVAAAAERSARDYAPTPPQSPQPYKRHRKTSTRSPV